MLSVETQYKLRELFQTLGNYELSIEALRQHLASLPEFEPYSAFLRLDRSCSKCIRAQDILMFLQENNGAQYHQKDCEFIINYFDIDKDGALSYAEFLQMVLPCDNLVLRSEASQRQTGLYNPMAGRLSQVVERGLCDFIEREIILHLKIESIKNQLLMRFDWNPNVAFQSCDANHEGFITYKSLQIFLRLNGYFAPDEEILAIVRRIDADADQRINFQEFC